MIVKKPAAMTLEDYNRAAQAYLESLPPEHFMESTDQSTQREITTSSLKLLKAARNDVHYFSELLVQYFVGDELGQVVPDNMIVISKQPCEAQSSFNVSREAAPPFMVFEYVSPSNRRKDYVDSYQKYEHELCTPIYLTFERARMDLRIHRHNLEHYERLSPNAASRYEIAELELEVGLLDTWVRFWHKGELLHLPDELLLQIQEHRQQIKDQRVQIKDQRVQIKDQRAQIKDQRAQIKDQRAQIQQKDQQLEAAFNKIKNRIRSKASVANRDDILSQLDAANDVDVLDAWLDEMESRS